MQGSSCFWKKGREKNPSNCVFLYLIISCLLSTERIMGNNAFVKWQNFKYEDSFTVPFIAVCDFLSLLGSWMAARVRPREWNIFLRCQCPPAKDHHKQTCSWASWVYESLWWRRIHTILHLSKKLSETTIKLGFGFWLDGLADGPWKWGFALDWELSGSEDHSITCYINKLNQDGGDTRARRRLYLVEM